MTKPIAQGDDIALIAIVNLSDRHRRGTFGSLNSSGEYGWVAVGRGPVLDAYRRLEARKALESRMERGQIQYRPTSFGVRRAQALVLPKPEPLPDAPPPAPAPEEVTIDVYSGTIGETFDGKTVPQLLAWVQELLSLIPQEYRDNSGIDIDREDGRVEIGYARLETPDEVQNRVAAQEERLARVKARNIALDRASFDRLKAQYGWT